jgi:hypothetical protein
MFKNLAPAIVLTLIGAGSASAAMPLITDDTGTQGSGGNQIEISLGEESTKDNSTGFTAKTQQLPSLTYSHGITDAIDVFASASWLKNSTNDPTVENTKGSSNPSLGAKWRLFENERKTSVALKAVYAFPVSEEKQNKGLGDGKASWDGTLILSQELPFGSAHANVGLGKIGVKNGDDSKTTHISVAPVFNLGETVKLAFDFGQDTEKPVGGEKTTSRYWEIGAIYAPSKEIDLALGYIHAKDKDSEQVTKTVTGGLTWRF